MNIETKVGLLFFSGLSLALGFTLFVSDVTTGEGGFAVRFPRVQGLNVGDQVLYNGVRVGKVARVIPVVVDGEPQVEVRFDIDQVWMDRILVSAQSQVGINQGLLGGSFLSIEEAGRSGVALTQESLDRLFGRAPVSLGEAVDRIAAVVDENRADLRAAVQKLPQAVDNFSGASGEIREAVAENRPGIKRAVDNVGNAAEAIDTVVRENRQPIADAIANGRDAFGQIRDVVAENREDIRKGIQAFPQTVEDIGGAAREIRGAVGDNRSNIDRALAGFADTGENLGTITDQIASGKGTIGRLVFEDGLYNQATTVLSSAEDRLEEIRPLTSGLSELKFYLGVQGGYNTDRQSGVGGFYIRIEPRAWKFYEAGASYRTAPEDRDTAREDPDKLNIDLTLLFGWRFLPHAEEPYYRLTVAGGLVEGMLGLRGDWRFHEDLTLNWMLRMRDDQREADDRRFEEGEGPWIRAALEYRVWARCYASIGVDDAGDNPAPWFGLRAELRDDDIRNAVSARSLLP